MSLKVPPAWLAAPVGLYATPRKKRRPLQTKPTVELRTVGTYGLHKIVEVRNGKTGKRELLYLRPGSQQMVSGDMAPPTSSTNNDAASRKTGRG